MALTCLIQFLQPGGAGTGTVGQALVGSTGLPVTVKNGDASDARAGSWTFELVDAPPGTALLLGVKQDGALSTYTFTPDVRGGYLFHLTIRDADGNFDEDYRIFQVAETTGRIIPAFKATDGSMNFGGQLLGWGPYVDAYLRAVDAMGSSVLPTDVPLRPLLLPQSIARDQVTNNQHVGAWNDLSRSLVVEFQQTVDGNRPVINQSIASSTNASPIVVTMSVQHNYATGDTVTIGGHLVNTAANGKWPITVLSSTTFSLNGSTGNGVGAATGFSQLLLNGHPVVPFNTHGAASTFFNGASNPGGFTLLGEAGQDYAFWTVARVHAFTGTNNDANIFSNEALWSETLQDWGLYLQNLTGTFFIAHYLFDSASRVAKQAVSADAWYVIQGRKSAGNIYLKVGTFAEVGPVAVAVTNAPGSVGSMRLGCGGTNGAPVGADGWMAAQAWCVGPDVAADTAAGGRLFRVRQALANKFGLAVT